MDRDDLARLVGAGAYQEMVDGGMAFGLELLDQHGIKLSETELEVLEVGIGAGIVAATNWLVKHGLLETKDGSG
jgi:hypothetical protein